MFDPIGTEEVTKAVQTNQQKLATIQAKIDSYGGKTNALNTRLSNNWASNVNAGASRVLSRLDADISSRANGAYYTSSRAAKLDNLNTSVSSRAAQSTANTILSRVTAIKKAPTSGASGKFSGIVYAGQAGYKVTVSGSGFLRLLKGRSAQVKYKLNVDGKWIGSVIDHTENIAGGIRFNSYFKIYVYAIPGQTQTIDYFATLGD
ncbi:MAG: hypothetical protein CR975_02125 [Gammaproteobacteria bacterium]|nr:MAG: hypothetical protein CR975_02125 [Gammaproteobacteria bacterium]